MQFMVDLHDFVISRKKEAMNEDIDNRKWF